jgi:hypothetical protein
MTVLHSTPCPALPTDEVDVDGSETASQSAVATPVKQPNGDAVSESGATAPSSRPETPSLASAPAAVPHARQQQEAAEHRVDVQEHRLRLRQNWDSNFVAADWAYYNDPEAVCARCGAG